MKKSSFLQAKTSLVLLASIIGTGCEKPASPVPAAGGINVAGMTMVPVTATTFLMGTPAQQKGRDFQHIGEDLHEVSLSRDFLVASTEVTEAQWRTVMGTSVETSRGKNYAVTRVSWFDAVNFCNRLSGLVGLAPAYTVEGKRIRWNWTSDGYRLPSESEWECFARAGTSTLFSFGDELSPGLAAYDFQGGSKPVDALPPNPWGLHGVHTGAWEWCWDWFGRYPKFAVTDPMRPRSVAADSQRVVRGGGNCDYVNGYVRSAYRNRFEEGADYNDNIGFRPVRFVESLLGNVDDPLLAGPSATGEPALLTIETPTDRILVSVAESDLYLTPVRDLALSPGSHVIRLVDPRYQPAAEIFVAESAVSDVIRLRPEPIYGRLEVRAVDEHGSERKVPLIIDGSIVGTTPWQGDVRAGGHQLRAENSSAGIVVAPEGTTRAVVKLGSDERNSAGLLMRSIPPGTYVMGSARWEEGHAKDESLHIVRIRGAFLAAETEVTQAQWSAVMGEGKTSDIGPTRTRTEVLHGTPLHGTRPGVEEIIGDDLPVVHVNWFDAVEFCNRLSVAEGLETAYDVDEDGVHWRRDSGGYRLPTEAEWEYMARAGTRTRFWSGESEEGLVRVDWMAENAQGRAHAVGSRTANPWGLYDLHGNVWEWCWDWYAVRPPQAALVDPSGPSQASLARPDRVSRGSGWSGAPWTCRLANRNRDKPEGDALRHVGFRIVRSDGSTSTDSRGGES